MDKKIEYTHDEVVVKLRKSLYKMVKKTFKGTSANKKKSKEKTKNIINDILDPNYVAEVNPDNIPEEKESVLWKGKGVGKLRKFKKKKKEKRDSVKSKELHNKIK